MLLGEGRLDGNAIANLHCHDLIEKTILPAVLPDALSEEAFRLVLRILSDQYAPTSQ